MNIFPRAITSIIFCLMALAIVSHTLAQAPAAYREELDKWHRQRIEELKAENGWLNLAGLYWLTPGRNTFGSGQDQQVRFPGGTIPLRAGYFELADGRVKMVVQDGVSITVNGKPVYEAVVFHTDSVRAPDVRHGDLKWNVIRREDKFGVRLRHLKSPAVHDFSGIDRYATDTSWRITAVLLPSGTAGVSITNVLGQTSVQVSPGKLSFSIGGKAYTLDALDGGKDELFIIFGDETNGVETYPSGRYIYVKRPGEDGVTTIDFNKAYNPPCAFTDYATCPLPPRQNILPVPVTAGEKNYGTHK